jgi:hypothetical protein
VDLLRIDSSYKIHKAPHSQKMVFFSIQKQFTVGIGHLEKRVHYLRLCETCDYHSCDYEDGCNKACDVVHPRNALLSIQRKEPAPLLLILNNTLFPSSMYKSKQSTKRDKKFWKEPTAYFLVGRVYCCWSSPAQAYPFSGPVGTYDHTFVLSKMFTYFEMGQAFR